jgi:hypothetical protein
VRTHFWLFTEVVRKIPGEVTRKSDGPTNRPKVKQRLRDSERCSGLLRALCAAFPQPRGPPPISVAEIQIAVNLRIMKALTARFFVAAFIFATAAVAFANPPKSKIITGNDSTLVITVPDDHFMKITNFTQDGGTDRAVVEVTLPGNTDNGGTTIVLTATRIDFSTGSNSQNSPEIGNQVTIAGPARVTVRPVVGAKLFISYRNQL